MAMIVREENNIQKETLWIQDSEVFKCLSLWLNNVHSTFGILFFSSHSLDFHFHSVFVRCFGRLLYSLNGQAVVDIFSLVLTSEYEWEKFLKMNRKNAIHNHWWYTMYDFARFNICFEIGMYYYCMKIWNEKNKI